MDRKQVKQSEIDSLANFIREILREGQGRGSTKEIPVPESSPLYTVAKSLSKLSLNLSKLREYDKKRIKEINGCADELQESRQNFRDFADMLPQAAFEADTSVNINYSNKIGRDKFGLTQEMIGSGISLFDIIAPESREAVHEYVERVRSEYTDEVVEIRVLPTGGTPLPVLLHLSFLRRHRRNDTFRGLIIDISKQKETEKRLKKLATKDTLTGVYNRNALKEQLEIKINEAHREKATRAVIALDIYRFKEINDRYGQAAGDRLLFQFTERIKGCLRKTDFIARTGGDEFVIYIANITRDIDAGIVANKINEVCRESFWIRTNDKEQNLIDVNIKTNMGVAVFPRDGEKYEELIEHAYLALDIAKKESNFKHLFYDAEMNRREHERFETRDMIVKALANNYMVPYFQPIVSKEGKVVKFEGLARIQTPDQGLISPARFIPVAEETGLILDIGQVILYKVCKAAQRWHKQGKRVFASVNVSSKQLTESFFNTVMSILDLSGFDPSYLYLEVTEETLMKKLDTAIEIMERLRREGVKFSIDDFGTGYSSLARLKNLPVDELKIDRAFVTGINKNGSGELNRAVIRGVVDIANASGATTVIEGAETQEEIDVLYELGGNYIQGYYFSKPVPEEEFTALLENNFSLT